MFRAVLLSALALATSTGTNCPVYYRNSDPSCSRLVPDNVFIEGIPCEAGAKSNMKIFGKNEFPSNETLTAGDYQYRVYEQGVKSFVASGADDIMKVSV